MREKNEGDRCHIKLNMRAAERRNASEITLNMRQGRIKENGVYDKKNKIYTKKKKMSVL